MTNPSRAAPTLNWRTARTKDNWYTGPDEGLTYLYARRAGKSYTVCAAWYNWQTRDRVTWCAADGEGNNTLWKTQDAAKRACERMAQGVARD